MPGNGEDEGDAGGVGGGTRRRDTWLKRCLKPDKVCSEGPLFEVQDPHAPQYPVWVKALMLLVVVASGMCVVVFDATPAAALSASGVFWTLFYLLLCHVLVDGVSALRAEACPDGTTKAELVVCLVHQLGFCGIVLTWLLVSVATSSSSSSGLDGGEDPTMTSFVNSTAAAAAAATATASSNSTIATSILACVANNTNKWHTWLFCRGPVYLFSLERQVQIAIFGYELKDFSNGCINYVWVIHHGLTCIGCIFVLVMRAPPKSSFKYVLLHPPSHYHQ